MPRNSRAPSVSQNRRTPKPVPKRSWTERTATIRGWFERRKSIFDRAWSWSLRVALAVSVAAGMIGVGRLISRYVHESASFATRRVDVHGQQHLSREQVIAAAGLAIGKNVFEVSPERARALLLSEPWIESANVRRSLPGSYAIDVRERRPVALLAVDELYLVSDDGVAFKPLGVGDPFDMPVITGLDVSQVAADKRASVSSLMSAVALLHDYQDAGLWRREPISEIHIESDGALSLYVGSDATHVRLGKSPFRQKLERLSEVLQLLRGQQTRAAYVLLDNQHRLDRVTVRLR
ncbi:MAG TPA: FtsQ-type POTRA domain-containing protein [Polyangiales bacterium]|nr:FtsQ-type POTRA domain-containing protein [Polyangiales bacterium]